MLCFFFLGFQKEEEEEEQKHRIGWIDGTPLCFSPELHSDFFLGFFFLFFVCVLLPSLSASFPVVCFFFTKAMMWCERVRKKVSILLCVFSLCEWRWRWLYEETRNFVTIWTEVYSLPWYVLLQINRYANHLSLSLSLCNFYYIEAHH